jgi:hypothetical protein
MGPRVQIREVLVNEQEYQIDLTTALGTKKQDRMSGEAGIGGALTFLKNYRNGVCPMWATTVLTPSRYLVERDG